MLSLASLSRLLLALCLVITTTAGAVESVRMHLAMAGATAATAAVEPPCHGDGMDSAMAMDAAPAHHPAPHASPSPDAPMDCCQSGHCDGICLLSLPPLPAALAVVASPPPSERHTVEASHDHPAPRLAQPQRPPIA